MNTILVLYNTASEEGSIAKQSSLNVTKACLDLNYSTLLIDVNSVDIERILSNTRNPIVLNMAHGAWGEDGKAQELLDNLGVKYFGSGAESSRITFYKNEFRDKVKDIAFIPEGDFCNKSYYISNWNTFPHIVKPIDSGSTIKVYYVRSQKDKDNICSTWLDEYRIVEEFIPGAEGACIVYNRKAMGGVIVNYNGPIFDYNSKYDPKLSRVEDWDRLGQDVINEISSVSEKIYDKCGCKGFLCIDFRLSSDGRPYIIEANSIPGMTQCSLVPHVFKKHGISFNDLVQKMIEDAALEVNGIKKHYSSI
jgi:D-alanine-D-alanine ligase